MRIDTERCAVCYPTQWHIPSIGMPHKVLIAQYRTDQLFNSEHEALEAAWKLRNAEIERLQKEIDAITKRIAEIEIKEQA